MIFSCFEQYVNFESVWSGRLTFRNFAEKNLLSLFLCLLLILPLSSFFLTLPLTICLSHSLAFYFAFSLSPLLLTLILVSLSNSPSFILNSFFSLFHSRSNNLSACLSRFLNISLNIFLKFACILSISFSKKNSSNLNASNLHFKTKKCFITVQILILN